MKATTTMMITSVLNALCTGGLVACHEAGKPATEVPAATPAEAGKEGGECLHAEGCCGGHTEGDGSCGQDKAEAPSDAPATEGAEPAESQRFEWTIAPGKFAEINVELGEGAEMSATFQSDTPLSWNVHSHVGDKATIHAEGTEAAGSPAFSAEKAGLYSYLWVNKTKHEVKVTVELRISGTGRLHSTHP